MGGNKKLLAWLWTASLWVCTALMIALVAIVGGFNPPVPALLLGLGILVGMMLSISLKYLHIGSESGASTLRKKTDAEKEIKRILDERNRVWAEAEAEKKRGKEK